MAMSDGKHGLTGNESLRATDDIRKVSVPDAILPMHNWAGETMDRSVEILIGMAAVVIVGLLAYAIYRWRQQRRVNRVEGWVKEYLSDRYGELTAPLRIDCSDDRLWPALVDFTSPRTVVRHRLNLTCDGTHATVALLSEKEEAR
jgi:hypothetical protein